MTYDGIGDDEILGSAGAMIKHIQTGCYVVVCIITKPWKPDWSDKYIENRNKEIREAHKILGVNKTEFLGFPTVLLDTVPFKNVCDKLLDVILKYEPDVMYIPFGGDLNRDHQIVNHACLVAARPKNGVKKLLEYETLSETEWGTASFKPNFYVDISDTIQQKMKAMKAYGSELQPYPSPRSLEIIGATAKKRGSEINVKYAEAFILVRGIE